MPRRVSVHQRPLRQHGRLLLLQLQLPLDSWLQQEEVCDGHGSRWVRADTKSGVREGCCGWGGRGGGDNPKVLNEPLSSLQTWTSVRTRPTVRTASVWTRQAPTTASAHLHGRWPLTVTVAWPRRSRQVSGRARKSIGDPQRQRFGKRFVRGEAALATHHAAHAGAVLYKPARHKTGVFFFGFFVFCEPRWAKVKESGSSCAGAVAQSRGERRAWVLVSGTGRHFFCRIKGVHMPRNFVGTASF